MRNILLILISAIGLIAVSCINDDFTTSSSDVLSFSRDTVNFDTVFTDLGTPTTRLVVRNKASKSINISSIRFRDPKSCFSLNVDGMAGEEFHDVEIRGKDSIYIFIECRIDPTESPEPFLVEDKLDFVTNGVNQEVQVEAYGQNVTRLKGVVLSQDTRLTAERPYIVFDSLVVNPGVTLSIDPGSKILFHDKAQLRIRGRLDAVGTPEKMIHLRGDRLDNVLPDVAYDQLAGQWDGVRIYRDSYDNRLECVNMRSTVFGLSVDSCADTSRTKLTLVNSWLHNSRNSALESAYSKVNAYGCVFSEAAVSAVSLKGGEHEFVQCTLSNYYLFSSPLSAILSLYHIRPAKEKEDVVPLPFMKATFENCIIYGMGSPINDGDLKDTEIYMRNVLLGAKGENDEHFIDCIFNEDPLFYTDRKEYIFNYRLRPESPAIGVGNPAFVSEICRYDMDGFDRLSSGKPDLGAYVFRPETDEKKVYGRIRKQGLK